MGKIRSVLETWRRSQCTFSSRDQEKEIQNTTVLLLLCAVFVWNKQASDRKMDLVYLHFYHLPSSETCYLCERPPGPRPQHPDPLTVTYKDTINKLLVSNRYWFPLQCCGFMSSQGHWSLFRAQLGYSNKLVTFSKLANFEIQSVKPNPAWGLFLWIKFYYNTAMYIYLHMSVFTLAFKRHNCTVSKLGSCDRHFMTHKSKIPPGYACVHSGLCHCF